ncbi:transcription factor TCP12-like [Camellia sinensis]|uniref:transcription factor TCP12-like n=1 Tax=Camellia sinensis TaxID=4442 RepID=UPI0010363066|nr:transcription factor TCP12-like [Camellia sinensis]
MVAADHNEKKSRKWRKGACDNRRAKESRDMARARARARTREKMIIRSLEKAKQCLDLDLEANTNNLEQLGSLSPFERVYGLHAQSLEKNSPLELLSHIEEPRLNSIEHQLATVGIIENFLGIASSSSTSQSQSQSQSIFDFQLIPAVSDGVDSNSFVGIRGNWDMEDARINSNYCALTTGICVKKGNGEDNINEI